jgi:hypothetical protein
MSNTKLSHRIATMGLAAGTAAALALAAAPPAAAADVTVNQQVFTVGPLLRLLPLLGVDTINIPLGEITPDTAATLALNFSPASAGARGIYNTINSLPFSRRQFSPAVYDRVIGTPGELTSQFPLVVASGPAAGRLVDAYRAQIASVSGNTPPRYTPFTPGTGNVTNTTNQVLLFLRNPLRPNGGIDARFSPIRSIFGLDTSIPAAGVTSSPGISLNTATIDVTWAYDPLSDFPVTLNPFSLINSALAGLPTNLLGGSEVKGVSNIAALGVNVAGTLGIANRLTGGVAPITDGQAWYGTAVPNDLPILEPLRLPVRTINAIFGTKFSTPIADALQPAFKILVNTGYSDVVTPADIAADPVKYADYQPYDRTFLTSATPEPFLSVAPLNRAERRQVPGDVANALVTGFRSVFAPSPAAVPPASVLAPSAAGARSVAAVSTKAPAAVGVSTPEALSSKVRSVTSASRNEAKDARTSRRAARAAAE